MSAEFLLLLLIMLPLAGSFALWLLRAGGAGPALVAPAVLAAEGILIAITPDVPGEPAGASLAMDGQLRILLLAMLLALAGQLLLARLLALWAGFAPVALGVYGLLAAATLSTNLQAGGAALLAASCAAVFSLAPSSRGALGAALKHLSAAVLATVALSIALSLMELHRLRPEDVARARLALALLVVALALRLGLAPLHGWLLDAVRRAPTTGAALAIGLIGPVTVFYFARLLLESPALISIGEAAGGLILAGAVLGAIMGALLAWSAVRREARPASRLRGLATSAVVTQNGFVIFGLFSGSAVGMLGALMEAMALSISLPLALGAVALLDGAPREPSAGESIPGPRGPEQGVSAAGYPKHHWILRLAGFAGLLALAGLPPTWSFAGRVMILQAAAQQGDGWPWLLALLLAQVILGVAMVRAALPLIVPAARAPAPAGGQAAERAALALPLAASLWGLLLGLVSVSVGVYPAVMADALSGWLREMTFLVLP